jgi:hypothetical protein
MPLRIKVRDCLVDYNICIKEEVEYLLLVITVGEPDCGPAIDRSL